MNASSRRQRSQPAGDRACDEWHLHEWTVIEVARRCVRRYQTAQRAHDGSADGAGNAYSIVVECDPERREDRDKDSLTTVTEAKTHALLDAGFRPTGTAPDSIAVVCRSHGISSCRAGTASFLGAQIARPTHAAVLEGLIVEGRRDAKNGWETDTLAEDS